MNSTQRAHRAPGIAFRPNVDCFKALATQDTAVEFSGQIKTIAVSLRKIANDLRLRWTATPSWSRR